MATSYLELAIKIKNFLLDCVFPLPVIPEKFPVNKTLFCGVCRARLPENKKTCHKSAQYLLGAAVGYDNALARQLIWKLKYRGRAGLAKPLADILIRYAENLELDLGKFIAVPMPLSKERLRARGFNQSELIARIFSEQIKLPVCSSALARIKNTKPQAEMPDWDLRGDNIAGAFAIADSAPIAGKNIILIDDVSTSGSTLAEAAKVLKKAGAKKIIGLVVAKAGH